jgi:hypothetical protein
MKDKDLRDCPSAEILGVMDCDVAGWGFVGKSNLDGFVRPEIEKQQHLANCLDSVTWIGWCAKCYDGFELSRKGC